MQVRAKKSLGQNFLRDSNVIERIVGSLKLTKEDTVVEIGPGLGALTGELLQAAGQVVAVEFDRDMVALLNTGFADADNLTIVNTDALQLDFASILQPEKKVKLVANLPYNISTPILQRLSDQRHLFSELVLMFQREVVERITAKAGAKGRGFLSVLVENAFDTQSLFDVSPTAFHPIPKVWSSVVRLIPKESSVENEVLFRELVSTSFAQKRKTIFNNLKHKYQDAAAILAAGGIDAMRRAETLSLQEWSKLTEAVALTKNAGKS